MKTTSSIFAAALYLPETKGKTIEEIEVDFEVGRKSKHFETITGNETFNHGHS
jgi:hypothetical protein